MEELLQQLWQLLQNAADSSSVVHDPEAEALNLFLFFVQWSAIILSSLSGLYAARAYGMDFYGSLVIAFVVALGGGTIRDMLLGRYPIFWLNQPVYAITVVGIALFSLFVGDQAKRSKVVARVAQPVKQFTEDQSTAYLVVDSLALGLWAYLGTEYALQLGTPLIVAPIMGVVTASFGGVLRDLFFARVPQSFMPGQMYAVAAAVGAVVYVLLWGLGVGSTVSFLACFVLTFLIRIASVKFNIRTV
ncbi:MAG: TRIC cation channel family protein [Anaerolineae bacterium]|nr:TRIC cation channel family protein [Anaerolineae bacterium]